MEKTKKTEDLKVYMKQYRDSKKVKCESCGGSYNKNTEEKHLASKKHSNKKVITLELEPILAWLEKRFEETDTTNKDSKTKRVNKNIGLWKKLYATARDTLVHPTARGIAYDYFVEHHMEIVKKAYATPSSQQSALSTLKIILDYVKPFTGEQKKAWFDEGKLLSKQYKEAVPVVKENAMSYDDLKKYEDSDKSVLAIFAHLYDPDVPALRLGDWVNAVIGPSKLFNSIILSSGKMTRRISKNNNGVTVIPLPSHLIKYFKSLKIKGPLFGDMNAEQVSQQVAKELGASNGSRYWRTKYVTDIMSKMSGKERLEVSTLMDHSIETNITVYDKSEPSMKLKKGKYVKL
jgi:hypothetical protein